MNWAAKKKFQLSKPRFYFFEWNALYIIWGNNFKKYFCTFVHKNIQKIFLIILVISRFYLKFYKTFF